MLPAYGVVIGTYDHSGSHQGQWLHELLYLRAGGTLYECAVDVNEPTGIFQYMILRSLDRSLFQSVSALPDGFHNLARDSSSGAIDYIRSPLISQREGCLTAWFGFIGKILGAKPASVWNDVTGNEAGNALVGMVQGSTRVYVFGAPYPNPDPHPGMHDVHMNQGDPVGFPVPRAGRHLAGRLRDRGRQRRQPRRVLRQVRHSVAEHRLERIAALGA